MTHPNYYESYTDRKLWVLSERFILIKIRVKCPFLCLWSPRYWKNFADLPRSLSILNLCPTTGSPRSEDCVTWFRFSHGFNKVCLPWTRKWESYKYNRDENKSRSNMWRGMYINVQRVKRFTLTIHDLEEFFSCLSGSHYYGFWIYWCRWSRYGHSKPRLETRTGIFENSTFEYLSPKDIRHLLSPCVKVNIRHNAHTREKRIYTDCDITSGRRTFVFLCVG